MANEDVATNEMIHRLSEDGKIDRSIKLLVKKRIISVDEAIGLLSI